MTWLLSVYIAATIFGAGVTVIDLAGLLGGHHDDGSPGDHDDGGGDGGEGADFGGADLAHDGGPHLAQDGGDWDDSGAGDHGAETDFTHDSAAGGHHGGGSDHEEDGDGHDERVSVVGHEREPRRSWTLSVLSVLRSTVYFSLGFGPVGLFALLTGEGTVPSLLWSVPVGVVVMAATRLVRRVMRQNLDSQLKVESLLLERGVVTVSIGKGRMGRVRVTVGGTFAERFARAADPDLAIPVGSTIRVTEVTDECLYVEPE